MTANDLAKLITAREGNKVSLSIAQVKEVMRCLALVIWDDGESIPTLVRYCERVWAEQRRAKKRKKSKRIETSLHKRVKGRK